MSWALSYPHFSWPVNWIWASFCSFFIDKASWQWHQCEQTCGGEKKHLLLCILTMSSNSAGIVGNLITVIQRLPPPTHPIPCLFRGLYFAWCLRERKRVSLVIGHLSTQVISKVCMLMSSWPLLSVLFFQPCDVFKEKLHWKLLTWQRKLCSGLLQQGRDIKLT